MYAQSTCWQARNDYFFLNIYLRCKNFQCSMGIIRLLVNERYVHIYYRWQIFFLRLFGLGLHGDYQMIITYL